MSKEIKKIRKKGQYTIRETRRIIRKWSKKISASELEPLALALDNYNNAVLEEDAKAAKTALKALEDLLDTDFSYARKSALRDWIESLGLALLVALFLRAFVLEAFKIPSGSMIPTLMVGDHIFVNKFIYGIRLPIVGIRIVSWGEPGRGEVIVFAYPHDPEKDYIKRVIGLPGDSIRVENHEVYVNGEKVTQSEGESFSYVDDHSGIPRHCIKHDAVLGDAQFEIIYEPGRYHSSNEYVVNPGHLFVMGDNRDNSADSRVWGQVPLNNIKGEAMVVWWSNSKRDGIRFDRIGHLID